MMGCFLYGEDQLRPKLVTIVVVKGTLIQCIQYQNDSVKFLADDLHERDSLIHI